MKNGLNYLTMSFKPSKRLFLVSRTPFSLDFHLDINDCLKKYLFARTNMIRQ